MKDSVLIYRIHYDAIKHLSSEQKGMLLDCIFSYTENYILPEISDPIVSIAFQFFKQQLDKDKAKYEAVCQRNRENGQKGGRPSKNPKNPLGYLETQKNQENPKNPNEPDNDNDNDNDNESLKEKKKKEKKKFTPPTIEEVADYISEKKYSFSAEHFVSFYEAKGWMIGKNKMKDWKAACRTWEVNRKEESQEQPIEDELPAGLTEEKWDAFMKWASSYIPRIKNLITPEMFLKMKGNVRYNSKIMCDILQDINNSQHEGDVLQEFIRISQTPQIRMNFTN